MTRQGKPLVRLLKFDPPRYGSRSSNYKSRKGQFVPPRNLSKFRPIDNADFVPSLDQAKNNTIADTTVDASDDKRSSLFGRLFGETAASKNSSTQSHGGTSTKSPQFRGLVMVNSPRIVGKVEKDLALHKTKTGSIFQSMFSPQKNHPVVAENSPSPVQEETSNTARENPSIGSGPGTDEPHQPESLSAHEETLSSRNGNLGFFKKRTLPEFEDVANSPVENPVSVGMPLDEFAEFSQVQKDENSMPVENPSEEHWILEGVNKSLAPSDFQRIVRAQHISGWDTDAVKVTQSYSKTTCLPQPRYILTFRSAGDAHAFRAHVNEISNKEYTLDPPMQGRRFALRKMESSDWKRTFALAPAMRRRLTCSHPVFLTMEHSKLSSAELRKLLDMDGRDRGDLAWDIVGWDDGKGVLPLTGKRQDILSEDDWRSHMLLTANNTGRGRAPTPTQPARRSVVDVPKVLSKVPDHSDMYALAFDSETEAHRFVRRWHRKVLNLPWAKETIAVFNARLFL